MIEPPQGGLIPHSRGPFRRTMIEPAGAAMESLGCCCGVVEIGGYGIACKQRKAVSARGRQERVSRDRFGDIGRQGGAGGCRPERDSAGDSAFDRFPPPSALVGTGPRILVERDQFSRG